MGREKQRDESVKALRNVRKSFLLPLVLQNFRRAFPASLGLRRPQGRRHTGKREDLGEEVVRTEKTKQFVLICLSKKILLDIVCNVGFKVSISKLYLNEVRLLC